MRVDSAMILPSNGVARHFELEDFKTAAFSEIEAAPYWVHGRCFNPGCCASFNPKRDWQIYCCTACERSGASEMRRWGHRLALPALLHRMGKYQTGDPLIADRTRAARRQETRVKSAWLAERIARAEAARS